MLYRASKYEEHNETLEKFVSLFNGSEFTSIVCKYFEKEQFVHDAWINLWGIKIKFDWSKKFGWSGSTFPYATYTQFERKFNPEKQIALAVVCNREESFFLAAWHKDFGEPFRVSRITDSDNKEDGLARATSKFRVFSYGEVSIFKKWVLNTYPLSLGMLKIEGGQK